MKNCSGSLTTAAKLIYRKLGWKTCRSQRVESSPIRGRIEKGKLQFTAATNSLKNVDFGSKVGNSWGFVSRVLTKNSSSLKLTQKWGKNILTAVLEFKKKSFYVDGFSRKSTLHRAFAAQTVKRNATLLMGQIALSEDEVFYSEKSNLYVGNSWMEMSSADFVQSRRCSVAESAIQSHLSSTPSLPRAVQPLQIDFGKWSCVL